MPPFHITSERLGAAAASTILPAGDFLASLHCTFCGATAAITPNRPLYAGIFIYAIMANGRYDFPSLNLGFSI